MSTYRYSQRIGRGGMANVYLAMQEGIGGFEKPVVIKRIFPHLCEDPEFVRMFLDEARLAATVRHPNIVEILDIGEDADGFFTVMEYLSGETVAFIAQTLGGRGCAIPPAIACRIGASVAAGLHHAHSAMDAAGRARPVIHRDVTPSNLIVCYNGVVKIVDFGVAKALEDTEESSHSGLVKGKMSYLAPEQIRNGQVDARSDVFQLGIVLHEMLAGRRLFNASTHHRKLMAVLTRDIPPPSALNPAVPAALDQIVLHALARDREARLGSADELRRGLEEVLRKMGEVVSDHDMGEWMSGALAEARAARLELERRAARAAREAGGSSARRAALVALADDVDAGPALDGSTGSLLLDSADSVTPLTHGESMRWPGLQATDAERTGEVQCEIDPEMSEPTRTRVERPRPEQGSERVRARSAAVLRVMRRVPGGSLGAAVFFAVTGASILFVLSRLDGVQESTSKQAGAVVQSHDAGAVETYVVTIETQPSDAQIVLDGEVVGEGWFTKELPRDGASRMLEVTAPLHRPRVIEFSSEEPPPEVVALEPLTPGAPPGGAQDGSEAPEEQTQRPRRGRPQGVDAGVKPHTDNIDPWEEE